MFTIHQPSSEIFDSFDRLILMNKGRVMYQGSVDAITDYFDDKGHPLPPMYNPADWIMSVAQSVPIDQLDKDGFFPNDQRKLPEPFTEQVKGKDALGITITERYLSEDFDASPPGFHSQVLLLFEREIKNLYRDTSAIFTRYGLTIFLSILIGIIFLNVGEEDSSDPSVS